MFLFQVFPVFFIQQAQFLLILLDAVLFGYDNRYIPDVFTIDFYRLRTVQYRRKQNIAGLNVDVGYLPVDNIHRILRLCFDANGQ
jgi:hypothetical protein